MNRRSFLKTSILTAGALTCVPLNAIMDIPQCVPNISYIDFDWTNTPAFLGFRIERTSIPIISLKVVSMPLLVKAQKLKIRTSPDVDLTNERQTVTSCGYLQPSTIDVFTNEILLTEAKKLGFTHLYCFCSSRVSIWQPYDKELPYRNYFVRGVKAPDWKLINGKLQVVNL